MQNISVQTASDVLTPNMRPPGFAISHWHISCALHKLQQRPCSLCVPALYCQVSSCPFFLRPAEANSQISSSIAVTLFAALNRLLLIVPQDVSIAISPWILLAPRHESSIFQFANRLYSSAIANLQTGCTDHLLRSVIQAVQINYHEASQDEEIQQLSTQVLSCQEKNRKSVTNWRSRSAISTTSITVGDKILEGARHVLTL